MKTVTKNATVESAYGEKLSTPVKFSFSYPELEKGDISNFAIEFTSEHVTDKEKPDEEDIRTLINAKRNAAARSSAQNEALRAAGIEKPTLEDPKVQLSTMVKVLMAAGNSEEVATQIARSALKL